MIYFTNENDKDTHHCLFVQKVCTISSFYKDSSVTGEHKSTDRG